MESQPKKLLDQVRDAIRLKHYSYRTEQSYVDWISPFTSYFTPSALSVTPFDTASRLIC